MIRKTFLAVLLVSSSTSFALDAGKFLFTQNDVAIKSSTLSPKHAVTRGAGFAVGDTIVTGANSKAQIKYTNGTLVTLSANTSYKVVSYEPDSKTLQNEAYLAAGKMHSTTVHQEKAIVKTPVVALAILGSEVIFTYDPDTKTATADCIQGQVQVLPQGGLLLPGTPSHFQQFNASDGTFDNSGAQSNAISNSSQINGGEGAAGAAVAPIPDAVPTTITGCPPAC